MKDYETNNCIAIFTITALFLLLLGTFRSALAFGLGGQSICISMLSDVEQQSASTSILCVAADYGGP